MPRRRVRSWLNTWQPVAGPRPFSMPDDTPAVLAEPGEVRSAPFPDREGKVTLQAVQGWLGRHIAKPVVLPCAVAEMTSREHAIFRLLAADRGFLLDMQRHLRTVADPVATRPIAGDHDD